MAKIRARKLHLGDLGGRARWLGRASRAITTCNVVPGLARLLQIILLLVLQNGETVVKVSIRQNVIVAVDLLLSVLVADSTQGHLVNTVLFCEALLSDLNLDLLAHLVPLLFVLVTNVFIDKSLLIFDLHVDWVIHKSITTQNSMLPNVMGTYF